MFNQTKITQSRWSRVAVLFAMTVLPLAAEDKPALPPLKGNIAPTKTSDEPFVAQPSGLPESERQAVAAVSLIGPDKVWTLPALIDEALRRNPSTSESWQTARAAEAQVGVAKSSYYPTVTVSASGGPSHATSPVYPGTTTLDQWSGGPQMQIQYLLLDFGGRKAGVESARFALLSKNFDYNNALQTVVLNVMTNYYNLDYTRANLENTETALALAQSNLESTDIRSRAGLAPITDVYQARQTVAQNQYNLENARGALSQAQVQLLTSVGMPGNSHINVAPPMERPSTKILEQEVDKLVDIALRRRPDLASKYANWRSQLETANKAEAARWPTLNTGVNLQRNYYSSRVEGVNGYPTFKGSGENDTASALLTFSWNVFDGGNVSNTAKAAKRQADAARAQLMSAELGAISDVVINFISFKTATKSVDAAEALVVASQQSYDSTNISYKTGLKSVIDLLTAQNNLASAKATLAQARSNLYTAAANLANATGDILPRPLASNEATPPSTQAQPTP